MNNAPVQNTALRHRSNKRDITVSEQPLAPIVVDFREGAVAAIAKRSHKAQKSPLMRAFQTQREYFGLAHVLNNGVAKGRARNLGCIIGQSREIIGHCFRLNSAIHTIDYQICSFVPAEVTQHHFS